MRNFLSKIRKNHSKRKGFTLAEVIIATSIFTIVSVIGTSVFVNIIRIQHRVILENQIYEDGRFMMERLAREIRHHAIDYEEYYRRNYSDYDVEPDVTYGDSYGCYAERFYNPGSDGSLGAMCNDGVNTPITLPGCIIDKTSLDINTGQNPYAAPGAIATDANAVCDIHKHGDAPDCALGSPDVSYEHDQLFLINSLGTEKTILGRQKFNNSPPEHAVSIIRLYGEDEDSDGIFEQWSDPLAVPDPTYNCTDDFDCTGYDPTDKNKFLEKSLESTADIYKGFIPLTPLRTNITSLKFFISPVEDPRKAFAETNPAEGIQQQPHVTVLMTLQPAQSQIGDFTGGLPSVTLQSTISSRVYNEVRSYQGKPVCP